MLVQLTTRGGFKANMVRGAAAEDRTAEGIAKCWKDACVHLSALSEMSNMVQKSSGRNIIPTV
jgi:hypothetical protein